MGDEEKAGNCHQPVSETRKWANIVAVYTMSCMWFYSKTELDSPFFHGEYFYPIQ